MGENAISELEDIVAQAEELETIAAINEGSGKSLWVKVSVTSYDATAYVCSPVKPHSPSLKGPKLYLQAVRPARGVNPKTSHGQLSFVEMFRRIGETFPGSTVEVSKVTCRARKSPVKGKELKQFVIAAWCEAFSMAVPTKEELKKERKRASDIQKDRKQAIEQKLRTSEGISEWNSLSLKEQQKFDLRRLDLSGCNLADISFRELDLTGTNFRGARFHRASFENANLTRTIFDDASLVDVDLSAAKLESASLKNSELRSNITRMTSLKNADLKDAILDTMLLNHADLSGVEMSSVRLNKVRFYSVYFDENSRFPETLELDSRFYWRGNGPDPRDLLEKEESTPHGVMDFRTFLKRLQTEVDASRMKKAIDMLKKETFHLFSEIEGDFVVGVVKSQTNPDLIYSCRLASDGSFSCCTQGLNACGGLRGELCKHILVLIIGLVKADKLDAKTVDLWARKSSLHYPKLDKDSMSEVFLRYKGAESGEIDWRPTETLPEDFYAF